MQMANSKAMYPIISSRRIYKLMEVIVVIVAAA
jgi:hypothetical protein